ncbi:MAG: MMPL family transporter, partial [Miltoncostaeaceae bacterium]
MKSVLSRIATFPADRRGKWVVLAAWILIVVVLFPFAGKFESAQSNEPSSFLPGTAESVTVLDLQEQFPGGDVTPAVAVVARDGGLTATDRTAIARAVADFNRDLPAGVQAPGLVPGPVSEDGTAQLLIANLDVAGDSDLLLDDVTQLRETLEAAAPPGLEARVTGPAGISADAIEVFGGINTNLLL